MQAIACILLFTAALPTAQAIDIPLTPDVLLRQEHRKLNVYLFVGPGGTPALTLDGGQAKNSSEADYELAPSSTTPLVNSLQGKTSAPFEFIDLLVPLNKTYYLNVTKNVAGSLAWTSDVSKQAKAELARIRVELFVGEARIFGTDAVNQVQLDWQSAVVDRRPEVNRLEAGQKLRLRITLLSGLSDFRVGTDPDLHATVFSLYYFDEDPLTGTLMKKNGKLYASPAPPANRTGSGPDAPAQSPLVPAAAWMGGLVLGAPFILGAASSNRRRALPAQLLVGLVLALAFGGCLGGGNKGIPNLVDEPTVPPPAPTQPFSEEDHFTWDKQLKKLERAAIRGVVRDWLGFPIPKVNVSMFGTDNYTVTKADGSFTFKDLSGESPPVLEYTLLFDHVDYTYFETKVKTKVEYYTWKNVTLVRSDEVGIDGNEHRHDEFGSAPQLPVYKDDQGFLLGSQDPTDLEGIGHLNDLMPLPDGSWICHAARGNPCEAPIPLDYSHDGTIKIFAGTGRVQVTLEWDATSPNAPPYVGLRVRTNGVLTSPPYNPIYRSEFYNYRGPADPFNIAIFPHETDLGHQSFTNWIFTIVLPPPPIGSPSNCVGPNCVNPPVLWKGGLFKVEINAFKGTPVYEIPHSAIWKGRTEVELTKGNEMLTTQCSGANRDYPDTDRAYSDNSGSTINTVACRWELDYFNEQTPSGSVPVMVPPGTAAVRGTFQVVSNANALPTQWGLRFKGADAPLRSTALEEVSLVDAGNGEYQFTIPLTGAPEKTDSVYQEKSLWIFYPDDNDQPVRGFATAGGTTVFKLTAFAVKDPASKAL